MSTRRRTAILISARGSNMMSLVEAARAAAFPAEIVAVISNRPDAAGIAWASERGIATQIVDHTAFAGREAFEIALHQVLTAFSADIVCLAGFMRVLNKGFVDKWEGRLLNIHPSLLPAFPGLQTHERALAADVKVSGCTVHFVVPEMDAGPIIAQAAAPVNADDTADRLAARILAIEHKLYPHALRLVASGAIRMENGRATGDLAILTATGDAAPINHGNVVFSPPLTVVG